MSGWPFVGGAAIGLDDVVGTGGGGVVVVAEVYAVAELRERAVDEAAGVAAADDRQVASGALSSCVGS